MQKGVFGARCNETCGLQMTQAEQRGQRTGKMYAGSLPIGPPFSGRSLPTVLQMGIKRTYLEADKFSAINRLFSSDVTFETSWNVERSRVIRVLTFSQGLYTHFENHKKQLNSWLAPWFLSVWLLHVFKFCLALLVPKLLYPSFFLPSKVFTVEVDRAVAPLVPVPLARIFGTSSGF